MNNSLSSGSGQGMPPTQRHGARDAFLYLVSFFLLYLSAPAAGTIFFQWINRVVPDPALDRFGIGTFYTAFMEGVVRWATATLLIAGVLYFFSMWWIHRQLGRGQMDVRSGVRRWLTYISLFFASTIVIVDLIVIVNRFLGGELGMRFVLKALTVLFLAAIIFAYYLYDVRRVDRASRSLVALLFGIGGLLLMLMALVGGFFVISSPSEARKQTIDFGRTSSLGTIENAVQQYATENQKLPVTLEQAVADKSWIRPEILSDSVTKAPYEYRVTGPDTYQLCAVFDASTDDQAPSYDRGWQHPAGRHCFTKRVDIPTPAPPLVPR